MNKHTIEVTKIITIFNKQDISVKGAINNVYIDNISDPSNTTLTTLDWIANTNQNKQHIAEKTPAKVIIVDYEVVFSDLIQSQQKVLLYHKNPKLAIAQIANAFFERKYRNEIHCSSTIHSDTKIGENVYIGPNCNIEQCIIGNNVVIHGNTTIHKNAILGNNIEIHSGALIGAEAHNFISDKKHGLIKFPHLGKTILKNNVLIGANTVVARGVLSDTIIEEGTKVAQLVMIGANNSIGKNCAIRANCMISGSVSIGDDSILAPSVTVRDQIKIGSGSFIGMGAIVTKNIPSGETWIGNPAKKYK